MIEYSTRNGFSLEGTGPVYKQLSETVMLVCSMIHVVSETTEVPFHKVAMDMVAAITQTVNDKDQMERVKRILETGQKTSIVIDVDAMRRSGEEDV